MFTNIIFYLPIKNLLDIDVFFFSLIMFFKMSLLVPSFFLTRIT